MKMSRGQVLFCFSLFETTDICLRSTKMEISTGKKRISYWKNIGKSDFAPLPEKCSSYASDYHSA